jgi:Cro/C1-type HTH DNA-binding domain
VSELAGPSDTRRAIWLPGSNRKKLLAYRRHKPYIERMPHLVSFDDQLRAAIKESGVSRYRISKDTGLAQSNLSTFMSGKAGLSLDSIVKLVEYLDLSIVSPKTRKRN